MFEINLKEKKHAFCIFILDLIFDCINNTFKKNNFIYTYSFTKKCLYTDFTFNYTCFPDHSYRLYLDFKLDKINCFCLTYSLIFAQ